MSYFSVELSPCQSCCWCDVKYLSHAQSSCLDLSPGSCRLPWRPWSPWWAWCCCKCYSYPSIDCLFMLRMLYTVDMCWISYLCVVRVKSKAIKRFLFFSFLRCLGSWRFTRWQRRWWRSWTACKSFLIWSCKSKNVIQTQPAGKRNFPCTQSCARIQQD